MHTLIMGQSRVDHQDGDGLNNQRSNLRPATARQNAYNRRSHALSGLKGVSWVAASRKRGARITANGERHYLGLYDDKREAALAYDVSARLLHGEFARLNFPEMTA